MTTDARRETTNSAAEEDGVDGERRQKDERDPGDRGSTAHGDHKGERRRREETDGHGIAPGHLTPIDQRQAHGHEQRGHDGHTTAEQPPHQLLSEAHRQDDGDRGGQAEQHRAETEPRDHDVEEPVEGDHIAAVGQGLSPKLRAVLRDRGEGCTFVHPEAPGAKVVEDEHGREGGRPDEREEAGNGRGPCKGQTAAHRHLVLQSAARDNGVFAASRASARRCVTVITTRLQ